MQYQGGKARLVKKLSHFIPGGVRYIEPFLGGANSFKVLAPKFTHTLAGEGNSDIALLWIAVRDGWEPPDYISESEYLTLKHAEPSPLRSFAGIACSFGGKWFGGYARDSRKSDSFAATGRRALDAVRSELRRAIAVLHADYSEWTPMIGKGTTVYCDPPYAGTTDYGKEFDNEKFWEIATSWAQSGANVFVSEYHAPSPFFAVAEFPLKAIMRADSNKESVTEKLFTYPQ